MRRRDEPGDSEKLALLRAFRRSEHDATLLAFPLALPSNLSVGQLIVATGAGLVVTILYLLRRDLWANMISHFLADVMSVLL
jgi:membrane protease YdiL (CAAX protease family)